MIEARNEAHHSFLLERRDRRETSPGAANSPRRALALLSIFTLLALAASLWIGKGNLADPALRSTLLELRAQRALVGFLAGAALGVGGLLAQGVFRNPLADPSVVGATAGASFGGTAALTAFNLLMRGHAPGFLAPEMVLPLGCLTGALVPLVLLLLLTRGNGDRLVLLLAGFLLSSLFLSLTAFLVTLAEESWELGRALVRFSLGNVASSGLRQVLLVAPLTVCGVLAAVFWARPLDVLLSGEEEAESLGVDTRMTRRWCVAWVAVLSAGAVAVGGGVSFVGLVVPHALRRYLGVAHRRLVPAVALGGGAFVVVCDVLTRLVPGQGELPLGVVSGLIGAPVFLALLMRLRGGVA